MISLVTRKWIPALAVVVGASFVIRTAMAWLRSAPALFPDEYIYTSISRSIAESGHPTIRGGSAHFPALLEPIVTAPAWLIGDVAVGFRTVQAIGALAMSLAAVPVFLLGRRLGLGERVALAVAAISVLVPDLVYASFISSEALAYPLLLASLYAATTALAQPSRRWQLAFVVLAGLTTLTRVQFAMLPIVFALATVVVGARERRVKDAVREQLLPLGVFAVAAVGLLASGPGHTVGAYRWLFGFHAGPGGILHWAALDAMTLAYAAGWIIVPGAILGLWLTLARPRSTDELAFGVLVVLFVVALFFEAGLLQASLTLQKEIQERYIFYAAPLLGLCFALYGSRGWPLRLQYLGLAAALIVMSVRIPLSGYAIGATVDGSPILYGVYWLTDKLGKPGNASVVIAGAAGVLSAMALVASRRPRLATPLVLGLAILATGATSAAAIAFDTENSREAQRAYLPSDPSFVDHAGLGHVALLQSWGGHQAPAHLMLFWNRSIDRVLLMPDAGQIDIYRDQRVRVGEDGALRIGGKPYKGAVLADGFGSYVKLRGAVPVQRSRIATLWKPVGTPHLALYAPGRYHDSWLANSGAVYVWPEAGRTLSGWLSMTLKAPQSLGAMTLTFTTASGKATKVRLQPGTPRHLRIALCAAGATHVTFRSSVRGFVGLRIVSSRATVPVFVSSRAACVHGAGTAAERTSPGV